MHCEPSVCRGRRELPQIRTAGAWGPASRKLCSRWSYGTPHDELIGRRLARRLLGVGLIAGLVILLVDPIHRIPSPAEQAKSKPCPALTSVDGASDNITMPDLIGQNADGVEDRLKGLGLTGVELSSANPEYKSVWVASNWTVVSTDPAPGCVVNHYYHVVVYVTK
jgi:hypothetical protein